MADSWQQHVLNNMLPRMEATEQGFPPAPVNPQPLSLGIGFQQPQFDVIDLLPEDRKEFLRLMRERSSEKYAATIPFETIRAASERVTGAANELKRLTDSRLHVKPDDRQVIAAERALAEAKDDLERTKARSEKLAAAGHAAGAALASVENWLRHGRPHGTVLEAVEVEVPKPAKNEANLLDQIENRRRRVRELRANLHCIQSAPYPSSHAKAQMREIVEQAALRGTPQVTLLIEHDRREIGWPMARVRSEVLGTQGALAIHEVPDVVGLMAWLHRDLLIERLDAEIDAESDDACAMSDEQRQQAEGEVQADLLDIERQEASLTWLAQSQNLPCEHRGDINPLALLGLRLVTAPRAAPPPTSPGHAYDILQPGGGRR